MSAGSNASNFGYGSSAPFSKVNPAFANVSGSNNPANFSSNQIPGQASGLPGLSGAKNNVNAAAGKFSGGAKILKRKIKNITKQYKRMKRRSRKINRLKRSIRRSFISRKRASSLAGGRRRRGGSWKQTGGYMQYGSNNPSLYPSGYSTGGINLTAGQSALANPAPYTPYNNCHDNYVH